MTSNKNDTRALIGTILEEEVVLSLSELSLAARLSTQRVIELVEEGVVEPMGREPGDWSFRGTSLRRIRCARRLERDLGVNTAGIALVLDLLDEVERLRARLERLEP
jgi:chaperone modulatory protein CbpM